MSRSADYLRSLTTITLTSINFYKLGQIAGYLEGLEGALKALLDDLENETNATGDPHVVPDYVLLRAKAALKEPQI